MKGINFKYDLFVGGNDFKMGLKNCKEYQEHLEFWGG